MIISHTGALIFIKTRKVGGTSFEIALSRQCGPECVITPITPEDEALRRGLGYRTAQNYIDTEWGARGQGAPGRFRSHTPAAQVRAMIPEAVWRGYRKLAIYRNPFDVEISRYYWRGGPGSGLSFGAFCARTIGKVPINSEIAPLAGPAAMDVFLRYERLEEDLSAHGLGDLWESFRRIRAKAHTRPARGASPETLYRAHPEALDLVAERWREEIAFFGYTPPDIA